MIKYIICILFHRNYRKITNEHYGKNGTKFIEITCQKCGFGEIKTDLKNSKYWRKQ